VPIRLRIVQGPRFRAPGMLQFRGERQVGKGTVIVARRDRRVRKHVIAVAVRAGRGAIAIGIALRR
jgi:hypothetical protein